MSKKRRNHSVEFKAKVALAALKGDKTLSELVQQFDVHPNQIAQWKPQVVDHVSQLFAKELLGGAKQKTESKHCRAAPAERRALAPSIGQTIRLNEICHPQNNFAHWLPESSGTDNLYSREINAAEPTKCNS